MTVIRVMTGITVERRTVTFALGTTLGAKVCETNPTDCCVTASGSGDGSGSGAASGSGGVSTGCCSESIPEVLLVTVTNKTGDCTCLPDSFNLTLADEYWSNFAVEGTCGPVDFSLNCSNGIFGLHSTSCGLGRIPASVSCDPFEVTFTGLSCSGTCSGTFDFTITG